MRKLVQLHASSELLQLAEHVVVIRQVLQQAERVNGRAVVF
jgi:hypothetical protein